MRLSGAGYYAPPADAYDEGGYEPDWTYVGAGAAETLTEVGLALLARK